MKQAKLIFVILVFALAVSAQKTSVKQKPMVNEYSITDKKALLIPDSLTNTTVGIAAYVNANFSTGSN